MSDIEDLPVWNPETELGSMITLVSGNITDFKADAIVVSTNEGMAFLRSKVYSFC